MAQQQRTRGSRGSSTLRATLVLVLVLALVVGGVAAQRFGLVDELRDRLGGSDSAAPVTPGDQDPAAVEPPPGLDLPAVTAPPVVAEASATDGALDPAAVRRALGGYLGDRRLGKHVLAAVAPLEGDPVFTRGTDAAVPASTTKVVTSTAALLALGPDHVFTTSVVATGSAGKGVRRIVLVGGGDPFLERGPTMPALADGTREPWPYPHRADLTTLAEQAAKALRRDGRTRVSVGYDAGLFTGPGENPTWEPDYVPSGEVSPTTALWVDEGRPLSRVGRVADPAAEAASSFVAALRAQGITVVDGAPAEAAAPQGARTLAAVDSAPLGEIVQRILDVSDNEAAEVLLRHVGLATADAGSIDAGVRGVRRLLTRAGVDFGTSVFNDGSGLSRANRAEPGTLVDVLQLAASADHPELRAVVAGLPVAGFTGSLSDRMDAGPPVGLGRVRAKTGTLRMVSSLAGLATGPDGSVMVFALMIDKVRPVNTLDAEQTLDSAAGSLGACRCGA